MRPAEICEIMHPLLSCSWDLLFEDGCSRLANCALCVCIFLSSRILRIDCFHNSETCCLQTDVLHCLTVVLLHVYFYCRVF